MNIVHIIESGGGSADFVLYLVKYLPEHNHQIIYSERTFGTRLEKVKETHTNARFFYWKDVQREIRIVKDLKAAINLYSILRKLSADAIHLHSSKAGFIGRVICFLQGRKNVIYTPNGLAYLRTDVSKWKILLYKALEWLGNVIYGQVVGCSKSESEELKKIGVRSVHINNGTEIFSNPIKSNNLNKIVVGTTGRITFQKNPALFNEIAKHFENLPSVEFVWIGDGELKSYLTSSNIQITGWMQREDVLKHVSEIDIYLSAALWEGLPFAVIEAMNLNKPLLLTNCVGNKDLVTNNGYLYHSAQEAIERLYGMMNDSTFLSELSKNSHELAKEYFDVLDMAKKYEIVYQQKD